MFSVVEYPSRRLRFGADRGLQDPVDRRHARPASSTSSHHQLAAPSWRRRAGRSRPGRCRTRRGSPSPRTSAPTRCSAPPDAPAAATRAAARSRPSSRTRSRSATKTSPATVGDSPLAASRSAGKEPSTAFAENTSSPTRMATRPEVGHHRVPAAGAAPPPAGCGARRPPAAARSAPSVPSTAGTCPRSPATGTSSIAATNSGSAACTSRLSRPCCRQYPMP